MWNLWRKAFVAGLSYQQLLLVRYSSGYHGGKHKYFTSIGCPIHRCLFQQRHSSTWCTNNSLNQAPLPPDLQHCIDSLCWQFAANEAHEIEWEERRRENFNGNDNHHPDMGSKGKTEPDKQAKGSQEQKTEYILIDVTGIATGNLWDV